LSGDIPTEIVKAVKRRVRDRHLWLAEYLLNGWPAVLPPAWIVELPSVAPDTSTEEIDAFTKVCKIKYLLRNYADSLAHGLTRSSAHSSYAGDTSGCTIASGKFIHAAPYVHADVSRS
jgi:hypothetical protein